ncbi:hypothetical protein BC828DRAFT_344461, partial [Blastocladiella britannica]
CWNRVVQRGIKYSLVIGAAGNKGLGLFAGEYIPAGAFLAQYAGEVLGPDAAKERDRHRPPEYNGATYVYTLDFEREKVPVGAELCVDAMFRGNVSRFINHSCDPNGILAIVKYDSGDLRLYRLAFFARREIAKGEEITIDYCPKLRADQADGTDGVDDDEDDEEDTEDVADNASESTTNNLACQCGAPICRGKLW